MAGSVIVAEALFEMLGVKIVSGGQTGVDQ